MKKHITTQIGIDASPSKIWNILMDFKEYPNWNPLILSITGNPKVGGQLAIHIQGMKFKPIVLKADIGKHFKWKGKLFTKGIFDGEHSFQLVENDNGTTTFIHSEDFSGILVGLLSKKLDKETTPGFTAMNEALKRRAEMN